MQWITLALLGLYLLPYVATLVVPGFSAFLQEENFHMTDERRLEIMHRNVSVAYPKLDFVRGDDSIAVFRGRRLLGYLTTKDYADEEEVVLLWLMDDA